MDISHAQYSSGILKLTVLFDQNIEGTQCQLKITYDQAYTLANDSMLAFEAPTTGALAYF